MQVTVNVTRTMLSGATIVFAGTADSIEAAIKMGNDLATGAVSEIAKHEVLAAGSAEAKAELDKVLVKAEGPTKKPKADTVSSPKSAPAETKVPDTASAKTTTDQAAAAQNAPEYSYEEVRQKILGMAKDKGGEITLAALQRFGVRAGKDLKPEQYAEAYTYFERVIDGLDPRESDPEAAENQFA